MIESCPKLNRRNWLLITTSNPEKVKTTWNIRRQEMQQKVKPEKLSRNMKGRLPSRPRKILNHFTNMSTQNWRLEPELAIFGLQMITWLLRMEIKRKLSTVFGRPLGLAYATGFPSVCRLSSVTTVSPTQTAERIEMPFGTKGPLGHGPIVLDGGRDPPRGRGRGLCPQNGNWPISPVPDYLGTQCQRLWPCFRGQAFQWCQPLCRRM